ncbi:MAG TPA: DUF4402 domain-containing protein [Bacteroidales bacterium]|nr:DUF4402 domain-containing protein [Bacteroidales bacterium]
MKKTIKTLALLTLMVAFSTATYAQVNGTAAATAFIVAPITITFATDLQFGNIAAGAAAGSVVLSPAGVRTPTNVTLPAITGIVTAASFTVGGTPNYTYSITLPAGATTISNGAQTMTVNAWTSNPTPSGTIGAGGTEVLYVGATLTVGANQTPGSYSSSNAGGSGDFTVTVNYN